MWKTRTYFFISRSSEMNMSMIARESSASILGHGSVPIMVITIPAAISAARFAQSPGAAWLGYLCGSSSAVFESRYFDYVFGCSFLFIPISLSSSALLLIHRTYWVMVYPPHRNCHRVMRHPMEIKVSGSIPLTRLYRCQCMACTQSRTGRSQRPSRHCRDLV